MPARKWSMSIGGALVGSLTIIAIFGVSAPKADTLALPKSYATKHAPAIYNFGTLHSFSPAHPEGGLRAQDDHHLWTTDNTEVMEQRYAINEHLDCHEHGRCSATYNICNKENHKWHQHPYKNQDCVTKLRDCIKRKCGLR